MALKLPSFMSKGANERAAEAEDVIVRESGTAGALDARCSVLGQPCGGIRAAPKSPGPRCSSSG